MELMGKKETERNEVIENILKVTKKPGSTKKSKWDKLVLSDDEDNERKPPFYDPETLFRMREEKMTSEERKNDRLNRMAALEKKKNELISREPKDDQEREMINSELKVIYATERQLARY